MQTGIAGTEKLAAPGKLRTRALPWTPVLRTISPIATPQGSERNFSAACAAAAIFGVQAPVASAALLGPLPPRMPNGNGPYTELAGPTAAELGALAQQPEGSPSVPASSTTAAAVARHRRVIVN